MGTYNSNPLMNDQPNMMRTSAPSSDPRINDRLGRGINSDPRLNDLMDRGGNYPQHLDYSFQSNGSRQSFERQPIGHSLLDHLDLPGQLPDMSPSQYYSHESCSDSSSLRSFDVRRNDRYWSNASHGSGGMMEQSASPQGSTGNSWSRSSMDDVEMEMQRLKLELKRTMEMYSNACKEALSARQKAREYQSWKMEEERKIEEARQAEGAAIELAEREKQRCRAALEAAEAAKRAAEAETRKRIEAERRLHEEGKRKSGDSIIPDLRYRRYTIEEIEKATQNFSESLKIGEGGYGPVFRGMLDHTLVAIKALRPDAAQGRQQFQKEVEILSCIRHPNMVLLLGACPEFGCLIYEYMANGSLDDRLFQRGNTAPLSWQLRFKIAAEIATGLLFLHQTKPEPLVHRDLKPANILLDHNFVSKISDVGLARLVPPSVADNVTQYHMTSAAGTFCYIDPEYQQTGMLGIKSDIYALGVILLQLLTAKPPVGIAHHVERAIEKGVFDDLLDPAVRDWPLEDAMSLAKMAIKCAELRRKDRPDLGTVVLPELNRLRDIANDSLHLVAPGYAHHPYVASFQVQTHPTSLSLHTMSLLHYFNWHLYKHLAHIASLSLFVLMHQSGLAFRMNCAYTHR
ncbi:U-box domain-containing protein 35 [Nymphaea thermarum]|nr:U-box domain-containing protein 35 [Nymphaea thermarum]